MFLHIGNDIVIKKEDIIAICDFDNNTRTEDGISFLKKAEYGKTVSDMSGLLPKSYIVATDNFNSFKVYTSCLNTATLKKRMKYNF